MCYRETESSHLQHSFFLIIIIIKKKQEINAFLEKVYLKLTLNNNSNSQFLKQDRKERN